MLLAPRVCTDVAILASRGAASLGNGNRFASSGTLHAIPRQPDDHTIFGGVNPSRDRCLLVTAGWHGLVKVWKMDDLSEVMSIQLDLS